MAQWRRLVCLWRFRDQCAAISVRGGDEAPGHVVAEERDGGGLRAVGHRKRAAGIGAVRRLGEGRLGAEGDVRQIDAPRGKAKAGSGATLPPLGTVGSVISTVPPLPDAMTKLPAEYWPTIVIAATCTPPDDTTSVPLVLAALAET